MIRNPSTIYSKIIVGILLPIFLFSWIPTQSIASSTSQEKITFALKSGRISDIVLKYGFQPKFLFDQAYSGEVSSSVIELLKSDPNIAYVEKDFSVSDFIITTNDAYFTADPTQEDKQWYLPKTRVPEAWDYSKGSSNVIVAIVDTGIHASHIELNDGRIIGGFNTITNQAIAANTDSDDNGHGTAVAGIIGAIPNNVRGMAGINWDVKIMPIKALAADGTGDVSAVAAGIVWAADHGANIVNLSLGGQGFGQDQTLGSAISYAYNKGVLIVAAAGNDLSDTGLNLDATPIYPICADQSLNMVLGVAATDLNDVRANFSNYGSKCIDISAPGKKILTTAYLPSSPSDNILIYGSGTSMATPVVAGIAALFKAANPDLSNVEIRDLLMRTSDNIDSANSFNCNGLPCVGLLGKGRINAYNYFAPKPIANGSLVRDAVTNTLYLVINGMKRSVSTYVFNQRGFDATNIIIDNTNQLNTFISGPPLLPLEGTLVKSLNDPTVYVINQELKRPLTYLTFISRGYSFANVQSLSDVELLSYPVGDWYWPPDGTLVLIKGNPLVYVMDQQVARPVTYFVFTERHLSFTRVIAVTPDEFTHVPVPPDSYWLAPIDGTLVKSTTESTIYVIETGKKRALSYDVFIARNYKFSNVKNLPQAEIDVIAPGIPLIVP
jgi:hypothetical protein